MFFFKGDIDSTKLKMTLMNTEHIIAYVWPADHKSYWKIKCSSVNMKAVRELTQKHGIKAIDVNKMKKMLIFA